MDLVDALEKIGVPAYGPKADGARLEASKIFTKQLLLKHKIPTAPAAFFHEVAPALEYLKKRGAPIVIKADGLAAGKGVSVASTLAEAETAVRDMLAGGKFGAAGKEILIEDCLTGEETFSVAGLEGAATAPREVAVTADGREFRARVRIDTPGEWAYYQHGGIMQYVLRSLL